VNYCTRTPLNTDLKFTRF